MQRGYIKLWRKIEDSGLLGNADVCQMFMYLLVKATHKPRKVMVGSRVVELQAGQFFTSRSLLVRDLNSTEKRVRMALSALQNMEILGQERAKSGTVISLLNWDTYQQQTPPSGPSEGQERAKEGPSEGQHIYIKQECKNERIRKEKNTQKEKPLKRPYGEFQNVLFTDDEYSKLVEKHGKALVLSLTEEMSAGIEAKGYKYKSHYAAFRTWAERRGKEDERNRSPATVRATTVSQQRALERDRRAKEILKELGEDDGQDEDAKLLEGFEFGLSAKPAIGCRTQNASACLAPRFGEIQ